MMKLYPAFIFSGLIFLCSCRTSNEIRTQMRAKLDSSLSRTQYETGKLKYFNERNETLKKKGVIYDSVYSNINKLISSHQHQIDSVNKEATRLKKKTDSRIRYRMQYKKTNRRITGVHKDAYINVADEDTLFNLLDRTLIEADLSIEKDRLGGMLKDAASQLKKEGAVVAEIGNTNNKVLEESRIDSSTTINVDKRLSYYKRRMDSLGVEIKSAGEQLDSPVDTKKNFSGIKAKILLIDSVVNKKASAREFTYGMISEGLEKSYPNLFNLAAFFGPGGYVIPPEKYSYAYEYFGPILDSLKQFSDKYESVFRTTSLIIRGYADATTVRKGSSLYKKLCSHLDKENAEREELNLALSTLRSEEISKMLTIILKQKVPEFKSISRVTFETIEAGYGEKLPRHTISDYKTDDERRRIVMIFWSVLPNE